MMLIAVHGYISSQLEAETLSRQPHQRCEHLDILPACSRSGTTVGMPQRELSAVLQLHRIDQYGLDIVEQRQASNDDGISINMRVFCLPQNSDEETPLISANWRH